MHENIVFAQKTDRGNLRPENEDAFWPEGSQHPYLESPYGLLFIIADGMGGHGAGDVASRIAVEIISDVYYQKSAKDDPADRLKEAIQAAQQVIRLTANKMSDAEGMGTTVVGAVIKDNQLTMAWVGDSRLYILSNEDHRLKLLSRDHSLLWPKIATGQITWEEFHNHPLRSQISNALTAQRRSVEVEIERYQLKSGDQVLLCTDGLTGEVHEAEIQTILTFHPPKKAAALLERAAKAPKSWLNNGRKTHSVGGEDNITSIIIQMPGGKPRPIFPLTQKVLWPIIAGVFLTILILLFISAYLFWFPIQQSSPPLVSTKPVVTNSAVSQFAEPTSTPTSTPTRFEELSISDLLTQSTPSIFEVPTLMNAFTPTLAPILETPTLIPTNTPTSTPTPFPPTDTPSPTATIMLEVSSSIILLEPHDKFVLAHNQSVLEFKWRWGESSTCKLLPPGYGFELRVWPNRPDALDNPPLGAMDAKREQINIHCDPSTGIYSYLLGDIKSAGGISEVSTGEFLWNVVLVQIEPDYNDKPIVEAQPYLLKFADANSSSGSSSTNDGGAATQSE